MASTLYLMNTQTRVATTDPQANEFGHDEATFIYLVLAETGRSPKVMATYGTDERVGEVRSCIQDTGLGHRQMPDHRVVAVQHADGTVEGVRPTTQRLPFWVAK